MLIVVALKIVAIALFHMVGRMDLRATWIPCFARLLLTWLYWARTCLVVQEFLPFRASLLPKSFCAGRVVAAGRVVVSEASSQLVTVRLGLEF
jgi:hypothetical protein